MEKIPITLRLTPQERQKLSKRASKLGLTMNGLVRFWVNSDPGSPRAFTKVQCSRCNGTGKIGDEYACGKCRGAGFSYYEI